MNETKRRINEYKLSLPKLRERVIAVTLLLAISASMLTTVTFAWLALSTNPEVSGANTSIASNGNLEIALAWNKEAPNESQVGDALLPDYERNNTWGNLVNLSVSDYGLDNIVLRPALLNEFNLIDRPLYGPVYDSNGRVVDMNTNFGYAKWETDMERFTSTTNSLFTTNPFGVRAITSMKYGEAGSNADAIKYNEKLNAIEALNAKVKSKFNAIINVKENQDALASLMAGYMVENQFKNGGAASMIKDASIYKNNLNKCISMYETLIACFEEEANVIAQLLCLQAEINNKNLKIDYQTILSLDYNISSKTAQKAIVAMGFDMASNGSITNIDQFIKDYKTLKSDIERLNSLISYIGNSSSILWKNCPPVEEGSTVLLINSIINNLTVVGNCLIETEGSTTYNGKISGVGAKNALEIKNYDCMTTINNGILTNFHSFCGGGMLTNNLVSLSVGTLIGTQTIKSRIRTASNNNYFDVERASVEKAILENYGQTPLIANDTYGFAIDFWIRTNAANSFLTLQGNVLTATRTESVTGKDADGNVVDLYTITITVETEDGGDSSGLDDLIDSTVSYDVYQNGDKWYYADSHAEVTPESLGLAEGKTIPTPIKKIKQIEYVVGYEGDNRVWEGEEHYMLSVNSTTQGSGSCYVFYAATPDDQQRSLNLLKSMKVAFTDEDGNLLAIAYMDSEHHYADSGKVIVPLVLDSNNSYSIGNDVSGNAMYAITALEKNVATRITAIVYLDGENLSDDDVLSSADINGQINIQFGSSTPLTSIDNEELYGAELVASVDNIDPVEFDYDTLKDGDRMITNVRVKVTGTQPKTMTARFIRQINATQGSPEKKFTLTDEDKDGIWEGSYEFVYPGTYILRSVSLDGVERDLQLTTPGKYETVVVNGFTITSVSQLSKNFVMTDANSHSEEIVIKFAGESAEKMPKTVLGKFIREDGAAVNVNFTYNPTTQSWRGKANFVSSGEYKMQYVVLDGQYVELSEAHQRSIELILGMRVNIETDSQTTMTFGDPETPETLLMRVQIFDNNGSVISNLANTDLYYAMGGTTKLHTKLTWDSVKEYYYGEFPTNAGTWYFNQVVVKLGDNTNTLTRVNSNAPVFTIIPPTPPTFVSTSTPKNVWLLQKNADKALVFVTLQDASSATLVAKWRNVDTDVVVLKKQTAPFFSEYGFQDGKEIEYQKFQLEAPDDDGLWKFEGVSVYNVFGADNKLHEYPVEGVNDEETFATGIVYDTTTENAFTDITIAVLSEKNINVSYDFSGAASSGNTTDNVIAFGKNASGQITSKFMDSHSVNADGIKITFSDKNNLISRGYFDISNVSLEYVIGDIDTRYGGYTSNGPIKDGFGVNNVNLVNGVTFVNMPFALKEGSTFSLSRNVNFQYAAKYAAKEMSYDITIREDKLNPSLGQSKNKTINDLNKDGTGAYAFEVWSKKPTVTISAISQTSGEQDAYSSHSVSVEGFIFKKRTVNVTTDKFTTGITNSNTVANVCYTWTLGGSLSQFVALKQPSVTITLSDYGNANGGATLSFEESAKIYSSNAGSSISQYSWTGDGTCTRYIGLFKDNDIIGAFRIKDDSREIAGRITANTLTLKYNGVTYTVNVSITINNPY